MIYRYVVLDFSKLLVVVMSNNINIIIVCYLWVMQRCVSGILVNRLDSTILQNYTSIAYSLSLTSYKSTPDIYRAEIIKKSQPHRDSNRACYLLTALYNGMTVNKNSISIKKTSSVLLYWKDRIIILYWKGRNCYIEKTE